MSHVSVRHLGPHEYSVEVAESDAHGNAPAALPTTHRVRVDEQLLDDLGILDPDRDDEQELVRQSIEFLLEREPATSIGGDFELSDITRRHAVYLTVVATRLG
jgi:hypothetical protein